MHDVPATHRRRSAAIALALLLAAAAPADAAPAASATVGAARAADAESRAIYDRLCARVDAAFDTAAGAWVVRGRPLEGAVELALARGAEGDTASRRRALSTLRWMRALLDSAGGGYYTNQQSADPFHTDFEKLTWPNARRLELLLRARQLTGDASYERDGAFVVDYMDRVLLDGRGGFVSGQVGDRTMHPEANGEAVQGWLAWGAHTRHPRFRDFAWKTLDRVWAENRHAEFGVVRLNELGEVAAFPLLADHAELGAGLLASHRRTGRAVDLERAREVAELMLARFEDPVRGFRDVVVPKKGGGIKRTTYDAFENARAAAFLARLAAVTGEARWDDAAVRVRRAWARELERGRDARVAAEWALAIRARWAPELPDAVRWDAAAPLPARPRRSR